QSLTEDESGTHGGVRLQAIPPPLRLRPCRDWILGPELPARPRAGGCQAPFFRHQAGEAAAGPGAGATPSGRAAAARPATASASSTSRREGWAKTSPLASYQSATARSSPCWMSI